MLIFILESNIVFVDVLSDQGGTTWLKKFCQDQRIISTKDPFMNSRDFLSQCDPVANNLKYFMNITLEKSVRYRYVKQLYLKNCECVLTLKKYAVHNFFRLLPASSSNV